MSDGEIHWLERFVDERWHELLDRRGEQPRAGPELQVPFSEYDAHWFKRGIEEGLLAVERNKVVYPALRGGGPVRSFFSDRATYLQREGITQFAAAAELVFRYRWPPEQVQVETKARRFENVESRHLALDIVVWDRGPEAADARAVIAVEAKLKEREAEGLVQQVTSCGLLGGVHEHAKKLDAHKKYLGLVTHRSPFFICLTPTRRWVYWVNYLRSQIRLHEAEGIPSGTP